MSKTVYLLGHGRVNTQAPPVRLPQGIFVHWLGPIGEVGQGLSFGVLSGALTPDNEHSGSSPSSAPIPEHYLCGEREDVDPMLDVKIKNFFDRKTPHPNGDGGVYVLYPRGKTDVSLSSIFTFLRSLDPSSDWHIYWTCCRSIIGRMNPIAAKFDKASKTVMHVPRTDTVEVTQPPGSLGHNSVNAVVGTVRLISSQHAGIIGKPNFSAYTEKIEGLISQGYI